MTRTLSIRELTRNGKILSDYDYIDIEDKKSHQYKGVFVPSLYAKEVKELINQKISLCQQKQKADLLKYAGIADGDIGNKNFNELFSEKNEKYQ